MQAAALSTFMVRFFFFLTSVSPRYLNDESISPHSLVRTRSTVIPLTPLGNAPMLLFPPWPWSSALPGQSEPPWSLADTNSNTPGPAATLFPVFNLHPAVGEAPEHSLTLTRPHPCQKPLVTTAEQGLHSRDCCGKWSGSGLPPSTSTGKFTAGYLSTGPSQRVFPGSSQHSQLTSPPSSFVS